MLKHVHPIFGPASRHASGALSELRSVNTPTEFYELTRRHVLTRVPNEAFEQFDSAIEAARASDSLAPTAPNDIQFTTCLQTARRENLDVLSVVSSYCHGGRIRPGNVVSDAYAKQLNMFYRLLGGQERVFDNHLQSVLGAYALTEWLQLSTVFDPDAIGFMSRQRALNRHSPFAVISADGLIARITQKMPKDTRPREWQGYVLLGIKNPSLEKARNKNKKLLPGGDLGEQA